MAEPDIRVLRAGDEEALDRFFVRRQNTTMILRANALRSGVVDAGQAFQGTYAAAWRNGEVVGVAAHYWNGNVILDAPEALGEVVRCAITGSPRPVAGLLGAWDQVAAARSVLDMDRRPTQLESRERLYALRIDEMRAPTLLKGGTVRVRHPTPEEIDGILFDWRVAYEVETLGAEENDALRERVRDILHRTHELDLLWVLERDGALVCTSAFNADTPDCVQIGGVYTPPESRGQSYGRCVVAGSLLAVRTQGVERSVLFTDDANVAAQSCYRALGYENVGDYGIVLFRS